jgi:hypothetical protein
MAIERIKVNDYNALGNQFIEWAMDNTKAPTDLAGFVAKVVNTGIVDPLPAYIQTFSFFQAKKNQLLIRLPPTDLVQDTIDSIQAGANYFFPDFYAKRIAGQITNDRDFFGFRVGDYTISWCS